MKIELIKTKIPGCYRILPFVANDLRGSFVKTFHAEAFEEHDLCTEFVEDYYSVSCRNVLRGLHFQRPPEEHVKIVTCLYGNVMDVVVDLRKGSPTFGEFELFELNGESPELIYVPKGLAHGFLTNSEKAIVSYKVSTIYSPKYDDGILWNSVGIPWNINKPFLSNRDKNFISFSKWSSPFKFWIAE